MMQNQRPGEISFQGYGLANQTHGFGVHGIPAATNFFDQEGSAYLGELEEAFMNEDDAAGEGSESARKAFLSATPATLEIFPTWPMGSQQSTMVNSQSGESTDSGSAHNPTTSPPRRQQQQQQVEPTRSPGLGVQERRRGCASETGKTRDPKTLRRLAQNREAARKSRIRKKAYVQQLESSRVRLAQLEQDVQRARSQGLFIGEVGGGNPNGHVTAGAALFNMEYSRWLEEDHIQMAELREGLHARLADGDLRVATDNCFAHYDKMFHLRAAAANADVFHLISGVWTTPAERCFLWMGGFRPSEIMKLLIEQLDPLTEEQLLCMGSLQQSSQQAEEALSQGVELLRLSLASAIVSTSGVGDHFMNQMALALDKLSDLEGLVRQADNLRQQTLHQLHRILTIRQTARCFLVIGEYRNRLRALSALWTSQSRG